ncbi:MAG: hypothetical protein QXS02_00430 [Candidatus Thermoplasmatota archaeon]
MKINKRLILIGLLLLITTMVVASQFAVTRVKYEYYIVHPSEGNIRYIGSDNSSDGKRVLRVEGENSSTATLTIRLGNFSARTNKTYTAAFGIVNEEPYPVNITNITIVSSNVTYIKIWLHGNRTANAESNITDPSSILMYNNGTIINNTNKTRWWILASGDMNASTICANTSDPDNTTIVTPWDNVTHVRYTINNTNAVSGLSDFVWVQVMVALPDKVDKAGYHTGIMMIHLKAETHI